MRVIIEQLDPDLYDWSMLEYKHISHIMKKNVIFTNIKQQDQAKLEPLGEVKAKSIKDLNFKNVCILDPQAKKTLGPDDHFDFYLFGGVLGNHPMDARTERELSQYLTHCEKRNLGKVQMSTDTAVLVTKKIVVDKISFDQLEFKDEIEIEIEPGYSNILPYRYLMEKGHIILTPGLKEHLQQE